MVSRERRGGARVGAVSASRGYGRRPRWIATSSIVERLQLKDPIHLIDLFMSLISDWFGLPSVLQCGAFGTLEPGRAAPSGAAAGASGRLRLMPQARANRALQGVTSLGAP